MEIESSAIFWGIATIASVVGSHFRATGKIERLGDKVSALDDTTKANTEELVELGQSVAVIQSKVTNGAFVRREECIHCKPKASGE